MHGQPDIGNGLVARAARAGQQARSADARTDVGAIAPLDAGTLLYTGRAEDGVGSLALGARRAHGTSHRVSSGLEQYTSVAASADGRTIAASRAQSAREPVDRADPRSPGRSRPTSSPYGPPGVRALSPRVRGNALYYLSAFGSGDGLWRFQDGQSTEIWKGSQGALLEPAAVRGIGCTSRSSAQNERPPDADDRGHGRQRHVAPARADSIDVLGTADGPPTASGSSSPADRREADKKLQTGLFKIPTDGGGRSCSPPATSPIRCSRTTTVRSSTAGPTSAVSSKLIAVRRQRQSRWI